MAKKKKVKSSNKKKTFKKYKSKSNFRDEKKIKNNLKRK